MWIAELTDTSARVAETRKRKAKVELLAQCLRDAAPEERGLVALYLSGSVRQQRLSVGYKLLHSVRDVPPAASPALGVLELDARLAALAALAGKGSAAQRLASLRELLGRASEREQNF